MIKKVETDMYLIYVDVDTSVIGPLVRLIIANRHKEQAIKIAMEYDEFVDAFTKILQFVKKAEKYEEEEEGGE